MNLQMYVYILRVCVCVCVCVHGNRYVNIPMTTLDLLQLNESYFWLKMSEIFTCTMCFHHNGEF